MPQSSTSYDEGGDHTVNDCVSIALDNRLAVLSVFCPVIRRDESNEAIINSLLDCVKLLHFYKKLLSRWIKKFTKFGGRCAEGSVKEAIDLKARVALELERCDELKLKGIRKRKNGSESESDDFEDVPEKEGWLLLNFDYSLIPPLSGRLKMRHMPRYSGRSCTEPVSGNGNEKIAERIFYSNVKSVFLEGCLDVLQRKLI
uniref:Uncharacterized protein n=1 Tax=Parascaris equorum TaxID=6256 RepID=A0A914RWP9_PAREQ